MNISASLHAWKQTHFYPDPGLQIARPSTKNIIVKTWKLFAGFKMPRTIIHTFPTFPYDTVILKTKNGLSINCWYSETGPGAKGTVILFHGLSVDKSFVMHEAEEFRFMSYNVMMVDLRAHGNSEGSVTSIGYRESEEVKLAYDYIKGKGESNIFLWGQSLGAVVIAKAIFDYDMKPAGAMLEMPFFSLQSFVEGRAKLQGFPGEPFGFFVTAWIGIERGYNGFSLKLTDYAKKITCPVLLQWGTRDPFITDNQAHKLFDQIPGTKKKMIMHRGAGHQSFLSLDPVKWREEVKSFLANPDSIHS
jgi:alpha-beta hydrolase superfamily lysophospholipase